MAEVEEVVDTLPLGAEAGLETQGANLLQDTVDQFEKVIDLERTLLRKSIRKLENDLETVTTELSMKEDELIAWEQRVKTIQQDNENKFNIAKSRIDKDKFRAHKRGRSAGAGSGGRCLGFIAEVDEAPTIMEGDEEDEDDDVSRAQSAPSLNASPAIPEKLPPSEPEPAVASHPMVEEINGLADMVAGQLFTLQKQWQELNSDMNQILSDQGQPVPMSPTMSLTSQGGIVSGVSTTSSTPNFTDALRSRLTVEQRIDRLQRDIRNETDRILQERGGPPTRSASGTPKATLSATAVGFNMGGLSTASAGSLAAPVVSGLQHDTARRVSMDGGKGGYPSQAGLHTPQSMSSRIPNLSFAGDSHRSTNYFAGASFTASRPKTNATSEASLVPPRQEAGNPVGSPTHSMNAKPSIPSGIQTVSVGKAMGSAVARCISPNAPQQVQDPRWEARSRAPQYMAGPRPLSGMSPTPTARSADPLQASIGSAGGPPRWTLGASQSQVAPASLQPSQGSTVSPPQPPPQPVSGGAFGQRRTSFSLQRP